MRESTKQLGLRIPRDQYNKLQDYAKANEISMTELIISIFDSFLNSHTPGLCPHCNFQNPPDADYCMRCAWALSERAQETKENLLALLAQNPDIMNELMNRFADTEIKKRDDP